MEANGFTVRRASPADRDHVIAAMTNLWPGLDVARRHDWLYADNPHGPALTWITRDDASGEIAGVTSLFPWRIVAGAREVPAALGADAWVYRKFRRRGIAAAMHEASRRAMKDHGFELMFGMPWAANATPLAQHGTTLNVLDLVRFVRPLSGDALGLPARFDALARRALRPRRRDLALDDARELDPRIDHVWDRVRPELDVATVRDATFYDWWFRRSPHRISAHVVTERGLPIAVCALERVDRRVRVLDLLAPRDAWPRALEAILACTDNCDLVELKLRRGDHDARRMWRRGFVARGKNPICVMLPEGSPDGSKYLDATRWFFTSV